MLPSAASIHNYLVKYTNKTRDLTMTNIIIVNDDQQDATILAYLFIPNQLYMFQAMSLLIIRST